jgi:hypothetical protein
MVKHCNAADRSFTVNTMPGIVKATMTDNAQIKVDTGDYTLAAKGDAITVKARELPGKKGLVAEEVKIEAAQPLSAGAGKKKPAHADKAPSKHGKKGDDDAAADKSDKDKADK